jgi:hypothetical protein
MLRKNFTADTGGKQIKRVRKICMCLSGVPEKLSHVEPTFFVRNRVFTMFANNHRGDGHIAVWLPAAEGRQEVLVQESPETYFRPP